MAMFPIFIVGLVAGAVATSAYFTYKKETPSEVKFKLQEATIIALKEEVLVFVEVKTMPNSTLDMLKSVLNAQKQKRIIKMSKCFLQNNREYNDRYIRFDVIILDMKGLPPVYHIENAFSESV